MDPVDAGDPEQDILALYTRKLGDLFQIWLDFLDLGTQLYQDLYIPIDIHPNEIDNTDAPIIESSISTGMNWDYLLRIAASGEVSLLDSRLSLLNNEDTLLSGISYRIVSLLILSIISCRFMMGYREYRL